MQRAGSPRRMEGGDRTPFRWLLFGEIGSDRSLIRPPRCVSTEWVCIRSLVGLNDPVVMVWMGGLDTYVRLSRRVRYNAQICGCVDGWVNAGVRVLSHPQRQAPEPQNPSEWHHPHHSPVMCMYLHGIARANAALSSG